MAVALAGSASACSVGSRPEPQTGTAGAAPSVPAPSYEVPDLPLAFVENIGQSDPEVRFLARRPGVDVFLPEVGAVLALAPAAGATTGAAVRLVPVGGDPSARAVGLDPQAGKVNYLLGADQDRWRTGAPTFARVAQQGVYPGIDLVYYGNGAHLEYDVVVAPGADAGAVRLGVEGATALTLAPGGDLVIATDAGPLTQRRPVAYQDVAGARVPVEAEYVLSGAAEVGFRVGAYDTTRPLVIDPILSYSTYLGGTGFDSVQHVAVDSLGAAYVTGFSLNATFPATVGDTTFGGARDAFVAKFSAAGALQWSTYLGGSAAETGFAIAVDSAGAAHIGGNTGSSDFPATAGAFDNTYNSGVNFTTDAFAAKLTPDGTSLTWATYLGGNQGEQVNTAAIALGAGGSVIVAGETSSANYPASAGVFQPAQLSAQEGFVTKLSSTGTLDWSTYLGGATGIQSESAYGVAVDGTGVYVSGSTRSADFPTTVGAYDTTFGGLPGADAFLTKFNLTGTALVYSTFLGGTGSDNGQAVAVDPTGAAYVGGGAAAGFPTTPGAFDPTNNAGDDGFIAKLNAAGSALVYSTYIGGTGPDTFTTIAVGAAGTVFATGSTNSTDFPLTPDALDTVQAGSDALVTRLSANGATLLYSSYLGGAGAETGRGPALTPTGEAWFVGQTGSVDYPTTTGAFDEVYNNGTDGFVTKFTFPLASIRLSLPGVVTASTGWSLRNILTTGVATTTFTYGTKPLVPIAGDWDGNGSKTPGTFEAGTFRLSNTINAPTVTTTFAFGDTRGFPVVGDWNGDGTDDVAVVRAGLWQTRLSTGVTGSFSFGAAMNWPNVVPVAGDWDGDGTDGIGTYTLTPLGPVGQWNLRQTASAGAADAGLLGPC